MRELVFAGGVLGTLLLSNPCLADQKELLQVLLQGTSANDISELVINAGGTITHDLHIIDAVGARLSQSQLDGVLKSPSISRHINDLATSAPPLEEPNADEGKCKARGHIELQFAEQSVGWPLFNKQPAPIEIKGMTLSWPSSLGTISQLTLGGNRIDPELLQINRAGHLAMDFPAAARFSLQQSADLNLQFQHPLNQAPGLRQSDFDFDIEFSDDCSTKLIPGYDNNHNDFYYNSVAGVEDLHLQGITGKGITVAIIDSGLWEHDALKNDTTGRNRIPARFDALGDTANAGVLDESGHGTHMASIIANSERTYRDGVATGTFKGVAPDINLIPIKVLNKEGLGHLLDITRAVQWVVDNREHYRIKVLNLSFAQTPRWPYWEDPVTQAVTVAWSQGITVVAAAGNEGPEPMTIGSPGNLPYIITVGAVTDSWTPQDRSDDYVPDFSSRGPTHSGHIKPDVVALGGHMTGLIRPGSAIAMDQPEDILATGEFVSTGSSQASALVSGIAALLLQLEPTLSPDDIKCKLISSAEPAINRNGLLAYTPFEQGYGFVNATRAVTLGQTTTCDNPKPESYDSPLLEEQRYGPAIIDDDGGPSLPGLQEMVASEPSAKGFSDTRKWGVKDHIERTDPSPESETTSSEFSSGWLDMYLQEKAAIEELARKPVELDQNP